MGFKIGFHPEMAIFPNLCVFLDLGKNFTFLNENHLHKIGSNLSHFLYVKP
jgi:hypothetical protein